MDYKLPVSSYKATLALLQLAFKSQLFSIDLYCKASAMNRSLIISLGIKNPPQIRLEEGRKAHAVPLNSFWCWFGSGSMFCRCSVTIFLGLASSPTTPEALCRPSSSSSNLLFPVKGWLVVVPACDTPFLCFFFPSSIAEIKARCSAH